MVPIAIWHSCIVVCLAAGRPALAAGATTAQPPRGVAADAGAPLPSIVAAELTPEAAATAPPVLAWRLPEAPPGSGWHHLRALGPQRQDQERATNFAACPNASWAEAA